MASSSRSECCHTPKRLFGVLQHFVISIDLLLQDLFSTTLSLSVDPESPFTYGPEVFLEATAVAHRSLGRLSWSSATGHLHSLLFLRSSSNDEQTHASGVDELR